MGIVSNSTVCKIYFTIIELELMVRSGASYQTCASVVEPSADGRRRGFSGSRRGSGHEIHSYHIYCDPNLIDMQIYRDVCMYVSCYLTGGAEEAGATLRWTASLHVLAVSKLGAL